MQIIDHKPDAALAAGDPGAAVDVAEILRVDIINGRLEPGSKLRFADLQARYGIGISPLREALSRLASDRMVVQETNRGFHVPHLSLSDFRSITDLRVLIEGHATQESVRRGGDDWEDALILAHHRLKRLERKEAEAKGDVVSPEWEKRHREFHRTLISACGSEWTLHFCDILHDQFDRYRRAAGRTGSTQMKLAQQHDRLIEAATNKDADLVIEIMKQHIDEVAAQVVERLQKIIKS
jgi:DNA-binding GntR family transcriptional regulator